MVFGAPLLIASFFPAAFSKALDFAGIYANCFLFGILPPAMAWIHRSKRKFRLPKMSISFQDPVSLLKCYASWIEVLRRNPLPYDKGIEVSAWRQIFLVTC
ncbi:Tryptophan/tyrosine permease [Thalictrum thalictroides]|uniref:Tryptophan/tyrosine permease n=1 Tax=Thalictrum thalictroides TaxID=46969 RepID=A0A7J6X154_THATH|nr:Tryptophan/tyrosine permease [Thalictrum thalictroides]